MSGGNLPGFFTILPATAILGLLVSSALFAYSVRILASTYSVEVGMSNVGLGRICATAQVGVVLLTGAILALIGGFPMGPLFGSEFPVFMAVYGLPLLAISVIVGNVLDERSRTGIPQRVQLLSSGIFAVIHFLTVLTVWKLFFILDQVLYTHFSV